MNLYHSFFVKPSAGEVIETTVRIHPDPRPALLGTVVGEDRRPVEGALIAVYASGGSSGPDTPVGAVYTDALGQFAFGPLTAGQLYQVRVCKSADGLRTLEQPD